MPANQSSNRVFEIAPGVTNIDWQGLNLTLKSPKDDWISAVSMFTKRIGRFLRPVKVLMSSADTNTTIYSGFAIIALDCLLIETIQSFRMGRPNLVKAYDRLSKQTFIRFLTQRPPFKTYFDETRAETFYDHFRNGILHQGEVKSSGLIRIDTSEMILPTEDDQSLVVNRWLFHEALLKEVEAYQKELIEGNDVELRQNFIKKMNEISRI